MKTIVQLRNFALMAIMMIGIGFTASGAVILVSPNGGESWFGGTTQTISWTNDGISHSTTIELFDGTNTYPIVSAIPLTESYSWNISNTFPTGSNYKIRITQNLVGESAGFFTLTQQVINVTAPNTAISLVRGNNYSITWTNNVPGNVNIDLYDGSNYTTIASNISGTSHNWYIPADQTLGNTFKVRVSSFADANIYDLSDNNFEIVAQTIGVTTPNTAVSWLRGTSHDIEWTNTATENVKIELYDGSTYSTIIASTPGLSYNWAIPGGQTLGTTYQIRVSSVADPSINDQSDVNFKITDPVVLTDPDGGEIWAAGQTRPITWNFGSGTANIDLYDLSGANLYGNIATGVTSPYSWPISGTIPLDDNYRIMITDAGDATTDVSAADFRITDPIVLGVPNGGEIWAVGQPHNITWTEGSGTNTKIELWNSFTNTKVYDITTGVVGYTYPWTIGATANGSDYIIKIIDLGDNSTDVSNADFRITQPVAVTAPNGGQSWATGSSYDITWSEGSGTSATLELWNNLSGLKVFDIATGVAGQSYSWLIPGSILIGTNYRVKVIDTGDGSFDMSDNNFAIIQFTHVSIPNTPGISWNLGTTHNITWTDNVPGPVRIDLYYAGVFHSTLALSISDPINTFAWAIPTNHMMGNHFSVRVSSVLDYTTVLDYSDFQFRIDAATNTYNIDLIQPDGPGIVWTSGQDYLISWTDNLNSPVKIDLINYTLNDSTLIAASVVGSTYAWHIPEATPNGSQYAILITSTTENGVQGLSTNYFQITNTPGDADIVILQPTVSGLTWMRGSSYLISWTDNVPNNVVDIKLCNAGGGEIATIKSGASGSTWVWDVPLLTYPVGNYKIKVVYNGESGISQFSFAIADSPAGAYIDLLQPDVANITWLRGLTYLISWDDNIPGPVNIYYERTSVPTEVLITSNVVGSTFAWTIPAITEAFDYFITIRSSADASIVGISANPFAILDYTPGGTIDVLQPDGGESWTKGLTYWISWNDDISENVKIDLINYAGAPDIIPLYASLSGSMIDWTIPNNGTIPPGILYKMRISSTESNVTNESANYFTIVAPATPVVYPNPANQFVTITMEDITTDHFNVIVTDRFNMQVINRTMNTGGTGELKISTTELANGVYFFTISSDKSVTTKKVIVQH